MLIFNGILLGLLALVVLFASLSVVAKTELAYIRCQSQGEELV